MNITTGSADDTVIQPVFANGTVIRSTDTIKTGAGNDTINAGRSSPSSVLAKMTRSQHPLEPT